MKAFINLLLSAAALLLPALGNATPITFTFTGSGPDIVSSFAQIGSTDIYALDAWFEIPATAGLLKVADVDSATFSAELHSTPVPEPGTLAVVAIGVAAVALGRKQAPPAPFH